MRSGFSNGNNPRNSRLQFYSGQVSLLCNTRPSDRGRTRTSVRVGLKRSVSPRGSCRSGKTTEVFGRSRRDLRRDGERRFFPWRRGGRRDCQVGSQGSRERPSFELHGLVRERPNVKSECGRVRRQRRETPVDEGRLDTLGTSITGDLPFY